MTAKQTIVAYEGATYSHEADEVHHNADDSPELLLDGKLVALYAPRRWDNVVVTELREV